MRSSVAASWISSGALIFAHVGRRRRGAVERHAGVEVRAHRDGQVVDHAAAPAEARRAELARRQLVRLQVTRAVDHVLAQLRLIEAGLQRAAVVVVAGIAADRRQAVGRQRDEARDGGAPRDVLDIRIQAAVLVNHEHGRKRARRRSAARDSRASRPSVPPGDGYSTYFALMRVVGERDRLRLDIAREQRLRHRERGTPPMTSALARARNSRRSMRPWQYSS